MFLQHLPGCGIVVHDKHLERSEPRGHDLARGRFRQAEPACKAEGAPATRLADNPNRASHQLHQALGDRQAQSSPAIFARRRSIGLRESLKQPARLLLGHADAGILDGEPQLDLVPRPLQQFADKADLAPLRELHGISKEIDEHLSQAQRIAEKGVRDIRRDMKQKLQPLVLNLLRDHGRNVVHHRVRAQR